MDPRTRLLSYSSQNLLQECARKYQLSKGQVVIAELDKDDVDRADLAKADRATFDFGHSVGYGVQSVLLGKSIQSIIWSLFSSQWKQDLFYRDERRKKSFFLGIIAIQKFEHLVRNTGFLEDFEVMEFDGKPAVELGFRIHLPDGYKYRGFVDVVLRNRRTGKIIVLEIKTSSWNQIHAAFTNSFQAIGYSLVLDQLAPDTTSYDVMYLVYKTKDFEWESPVFPKSYYQRALWLHELLIKKEVLELYDRHGVYPMNGGNCVNKFGRECPYLGTCTLSTDSLITPLSAERWEEIEAEEDQAYQFNITYEQLIEAQLAKIEKLDKAKQQRIAIQQIPVTVQDSRL